MHGGIQTMKFMTRGPVFPIVVAQLKLRINWGKSDLVDSFTFKTPNWVRLELDNDVHMNCKYTVCILGG